MEFLYHPAPKQGRFAHAFVFSDLLHRFGLVRPQVNCHHCAWNALEDPIADFFQLVLELRQIMGVPEPSEFFYRIS